MNKENFIEDILIKEGLVEQLFSSIAMGNLAEVKDLVEQELVDVDDKDERGWTPILQAVCSGHLGIVKYLIEERGVNVDPKDEGVSSPLMQASFHNKLDVVKYLVEEQKVDVENDNGTGCTPKELAKQEGHQRVIDFLDQTMINLDPKFVSDMFKDVCKKNRKVVPSVVKGLVAKL